jgi:hypothetical protein
MDEQTRLAETATDAVAVLGKGGEFVLVDLCTPGQPMPPAVLVDATRRGFHYCGILGLRDGRRNVECEPDADSVFTCLMASLAFAQRVADKIGSGGGACLGLDLERLWQLPDTRN